MKSLIKYIKCKKKTELEDLLAFVGFTEKTVMKCEIFDELNSRTLQF